MTDPTAFIAHHVSRPLGQVYARDYPGAGPAFVLMHGLPDNLHIYDELVPYLTAAGRRVVTFDFLGFGASDKPDGATYDYAQQLGDLEAVADALDLGPMVLVPHDSSGFAAINFALAHPGRTASVCMLNSAYADAESMHWPEMIELAARPSLRALADAMVRDPAQMGWLLTWQQRMFRASLPTDQQSHFDAAIGQVIAANFIQAPSAGPAYAQLTAGFYDEIARNRARLPALEALDLPIRLIWGQYDPYLTVAMAQARMTHLKRGALQVIAGGHWLQSDAPAQVAAALLS